MRKLFISALVAAMCVGLAPTALAAAGDIAPPAYSDIAGIEAEGALTILAALGTTVGGATLGGTVRPDDPITRVEYCQLLVDGMGRGGVAAGLDGLRPTFTDVASIPMSSWGYVNVAVYMGLVHGYADGSFRPNDPVTYAEAVTINVRAVQGHQAQVPPGIWPYNFLFYGVDSGFVGGVDVGFANLPCTRGDAARMVFATMQVNRLNSKGEIVPRSAVLADRIFTGVFSYDGTEGCFDGDFTDPEGFDVSHVRFGLHDPTYLLGAKSYDGLRALPATVVLDKTYTWPEGGLGGTGCVLMAAEAGNFVVGVFKDIVDADHDGHDDTLVLADGTEIPFVEDECVQTTINNDPENDQWDLEEGDDVIVTLDEKGNAVNIVGTHWDDADWILSVTPSKVLTNGTKVDTVVECWEEYDFEVPAGCDVTVNGAPAGRDELAKYDAYQVAWNWGPGDEEPIAVRAWRNVVEGTVISTSLSFPGEIHRVILEKKGTTTKQTFTINGDGGIGDAYEPPAPGAVVRYGLDGDGLVFVPIGYETMTPYALCLSYCETGDGKYSATFDVRGQERTYTLDDSLYIDEDGECEWVGTYCRLAVLPGTNTVDVDESYGDYSSWDCCVFKVLNVDAANGTMTVAEADESGSPPWEPNMGDIIFWDNPDFVVYGYDSDMNLSYIGLAGLKPGDWVLGCLCSTDSGECWPVATLVTENNWDDLGYHPAME